MKPSWEVGPAASCEVIVLVEKTKDGLQYSGRIVVNLTQGEEGIRARATVQIWKGPLMTGRDCPINATSIASGGGYDKSSAAISEALAKANIANDFYACGIPAALQFFEQKGYISIHAL